MTMLVLSVSRGPADMLHQTRHISSGLFQIGRAAPSDWILDDPRRVVSKRHCVFQQDEGGWSVADVSRNGSFLNRGNEVFRLGIQPHRLSAGERLLVGDYELMVGLEEDEASFRAMPLSSAHAVVPGRNVRIPTSPELPPLELPFLNCIDRTAPHGQPDRDATRSLRPPGGGAGGAHHGGLAALLEGALLAQDDVVSSGQETDVLRIVGRALRTAVSETRRLRQAMLGDANEASLDGGGIDVRPLVQAATDREALRWLLASEQRYDTPPEAVIQAAFAELRQHHDCLVGAARRAMRAMFEGLDPDGPERILLPRWFDLLPGWRRIRAEALARRRYRRLRNNLDRMVDQALTRAYLELRGEAEKRWKPR